MFWAATSAGGEGATAISWVEARGTASSDGAKWDATYPTMHGAALPTLGPKHKAQLPKPTALRLSSSAQSVKSGSLPSTRPGPFPRDDMATCHTGNGALTVAPSEAFRLPQRLLCPLIPCHTSSPRPNPPFFFLKRMKAPCARLWLELSPFSGEKLGTS